MSTVRRIRNAVVLNPFSGNPFLVAPGAEGGDVPMRLVDCIRTFLTTFKEWSFEQSAHAVAIARALLEAGDTIRLETADHEWLVEEFKKSGHVVFGMNCALILDLLRNVSSSPPSSSSSSSSSPSSA